jgi:hypothetical protein
MPLYRSIGAFAPAIASIVGRRFTRVVSLRIQIIGIFISMVGDAWFETPNSEELTSVCE